jgi:hypothetical protein
LCSSAGGHSSVLGAIGAMKPDKIIETQQTSIYKVNISVKAMNKSTRFNMKL